MWITFIAGATTMIPHLDQIRPPNRTNIAQLLSRSIRTHSFIVCLFILFFFSLYFRAKFFLLLLQLVSIVFSCCGYDRHFSFFSICFSCFDGTLLWRAHSCSLTIARTHTFVSSSAIVTMSYLIWIIQTWRRRKYWHCRIYAAHKVGKQMTNIK